MAFRLSLGKTVYSQLQNGYLALLRQCLELVRYMLPTALEYPSGIEMVGYLGYDGPLYDRLMSMMDNVLGPSPMQVCVMCT